MIDYPIYNSIPLFIKQLQYNSCEDLILLFKDIQTKEAAVSATYNYNRIYNQSKLAKFPTLTYTTQIEKMPKKDKKKQGGQQEPAKQTPQQHEEEEQLHGHED